MRLWDPPPLPPLGLVTDQPPFVARGPEVQSALSAWADVTAGSTRGLFIEGAPGVGKSRLIAEVATRLQQQGAAVFAGACVEEFGTPFEPLDTPLLGLLALLDPQDARDSSNEFLRGAIESAPHAPEDAPGRSGQGWGRDGGRLATAIVDLLREASQHHPIVLVLDDVHWASHTVLRLLPRLVSGLSSSRVFILAGARSTHPDRTSILDDALAGLSRFSGIRRVPLLPLNRDEVADYVRVRAASDDPVDEVATRLTYLTGGNPFLLREAWRQVADRGHNEAMVSLPDTVNDLLRARLRSIPATDRVVLEGAAVLGLDVVPEEVASLVDQDWSKVLDSLGNAVAAGLMEAPQAPGETYRFPHAIGRQAFLDGVPGRDLPTLHARAAAVLETGLSASHRVARRLAYHYTAAISLGYREQAVESTARAAHLADLALAHEEAGATYERAAELSEPGERRCELLLYAARSWLLAADFARARARAQQVIEVGGPRARVRAAIEYEEASWRPGLSGERAVALLTDTLGTVDPDISHEDQIEARAALARALGMSGDEKRAREMAEWAIAEAREHGDDRLRARVLRRSFLHSLRPQGLRDAYARAGELWELRESVDLGEDHQAAPHFRSTAAYVLGDRRGLDSAERALAAAAQQSGPYWTYWYLCFLYGRHFITGDLEQASQASKRASALEAGFQSDSGSSVAAQQVYMIKRELRQLDVIRAVISGDESPRQHWGPGLLGLYTEFGQTASAQRMLTWLLDHDTPAAHQSAEWPGVLALMTEGALFLSNRYALRRLRPLVAEYRGMNLVAGHFAAAFGPADRYLGQIDATLGTGDPGASFGAALELDERLDATLQAAHTRAAMSRWLRSRDPRSREGIEVARQVRAQATPAGWSRVLSVLDGSRPGTARADGLTAREIEILGLLDEGLSNRAIAGRLYLSAHTVANHVRSILMKTSSDNRSQAVRYARDEGLL